MCGIFGVIPTRALKPQQIYRANQLFTTLMVMSASRGTDAAGGAVVKTGGDSWIFKKDISGSKIVRDTTWRELLSKAGKDTAMWMGHTRAATCGPNTQPNAHPFDFYHSDYGRLLGSHNGMIFNYESLDGKTNTNVHEVDSACLFAWLALHPQGEWGQKLSEVWGSYALAMYRDGKIHMVRNEGSPLMFTYSSIISSWVYASERGFLEKALGQWGLDYKNIVELPANRIYSLPEHNSGKLEIQVVPYNPETSWTYGRFC